MRKKIAFLFILLLVFAGFSYFIWSDFKKVNQPPANEQSQENYNKIPVPSLDRSISFSSSFTEGQKEQLSKEIEKLKEALRNDLDLANDWLALASRYKVIGDYEGAEEIWQYVITIRPESFVPYLNLGNLYAYYLKEPEKAEPYYLKVIEIAPNYIAGYAATYNFYKEAYPGKEHLAEDIVLQGLEINPDDPGLESLLEQD